MKKLLCFVGIFLIILLVIACFFLSSIICHSKDSKNKEFYRITIPFNSSGKEIAQILKENKICSEFCFKLLVKLNGNEKKLKAGSYLLSPSMSVEKILRKIVGGDTIIEKITIPEGFSLKEITKTLEKNLIVGKNEYINFLNGFGRSGLKEKYAFLSEINPTSLEGFLFPDTYNFNSGIKPEIITETMLNRFKEKAVPLFGRDTKYAAFGRHPARGGGEIRDTNKKLSFYETLILASIVEKEAKKEEERPIIASVFLNRLKANMPLAADPTIKYVLDPAPEFLSFNDIKIKSPYNTYLHKGLPPTPICSPGIASIQAVLNPQKTPYYYFVANGDETHNFSKSLQEHVKKQLSINHSKR